MNIYISAIMGVFTGELLTHGMWWQGILSGIVFWFLYLNKH